MQKVAYLLRLTRFIEYQKQSRILIVLLFLFASLSASSQDLSTQKVNLQIKGASIKEAFQEIQRQSGISFIMGPDIAKYDTQKITISQKDLPVKEAIEQVLKNTNLRYTPKNGKVLIDEKPTPNSPNVKAGQGPGTLKGRIVEFESSQPLPGASVRIAELNKGVTSDEHGYYRLTGIPAGKYTLQVSYVSFTTEKVQVDVKAGKEETFDVKMQGSNALQEVVVSSVRKTRAPVAHTTEKQVLEQVKQASSVVSAISSEQITKSADRNAAEVVQKVSGVTVVDNKFVILRGMNQRYNLTYLNDNLAPSTEVYSRAFAFDLIPSRIIDRILVYKSPTPENLADATGGVVKIFTKDASTVKHFDLELQLGYRPGTTFKNDFLTYQGGKLDWLGIDDGTRKLPSAVPGYDQLDLAKLTPSQYAKSFNPTLAHQRMTALPNIQLTANYYNSFNIFGRRLSSLSSFSYKNEAQKTNIYRQQGYYEVSFNSSDKINIDNRNTQTAQLNLLQNFTLSLRDSSKISFKNFILQQGLNSTIIRNSYSTFGPNDASTGYVQDKDNILSYNQRFLYAGNVGGKHFLGKLGQHQLQWNAGYTYSRQTTPDQRVIRLTQPTSYAAIGDTTLQWRARGLIAGLSDDNYTTPLKLGIISRLWLHNTEGNYNASLDYNYRIRPWVSVKLGAFQQWKERRLYRRIYTMHEGSLNDVSGSPSNRTFPGQVNYVNPLLVRFFEQDLSKVWSDQYLRDDHTGLQVFDRTTGSDSYIGTEQNSSGYAAIKVIPPGTKLELYGGVRYEYNRQQIGAAIPADNEVYPGSINYPVYINNPMKTWLPSINVSWRPTDSWVIRAGYGKTLNRTEFREVAPYKELDYENNVVVGGNTNLKSATINNYDFRFEFYPEKNKKGEMISAGIFFKDILNPIERINTSLRVSDADFPQFTYQNAASATIKGLEIEVHKHLDFIPFSIFRYVSLIGNVSIIKSVTKNDTIQKSSLSFINDNRPLQGQAPYIINAGLYYENPGSGTKLSVIYNTSGTNIYAAGRGYKFNSFVKGAEYRGSLLELPTHMLNIAMTQRIIKSLQAKFSIQNVLDQEFKMAEDFNFTNKYEPLNNVAGIDEFGRQKKEGDNITQRYRTGRYFLLNLSYSF